MKSVKWKNPIQKLKCELHYANLKLVLLCAVIMLFLGMLTGIFGGGAYHYHQLLLPRLALSSAGFIFFWTLFYLMLGGCVGFLIGGERYFGTKCARSGIFSFSLLILSNLLWYPLFFGLGALLIAFVFLILHLLITLFTLSRMFRISALISLGLLGYTVWLVYCLFMNFCVILLNF